MKLNDLLNEKVLTAEFKYGFELEAILNDSEAINAFNWDMAKIKGYLQKVFQKTFPNAGPVGEDGSIYPGRPTKEIAFEWPSPVLELTPDNIQKTIKFLSSLEQMGIYTNDSCGFHVHISFPHISTESIGWLLVGLAFDSRMREKITRFKKFSFIDENYAADGYLDEIKDAIIDRSWDDFSYLINNEKYRNFRVHPQGTLEWRGPRSFLNENNAQMIREFFMLLIMFVRWISATLDAKEIGGLSRQEYNQNVASQPVAAKFANKADKRWSKNMDRKEIPEVLAVAPWLKKANFEDAQVFVQGNTLIWMDGTWHGGDWMGGAWMAGNWYGGTWHDGEWKNGKWKDGVWLNGTWENGWWTKGTWKNGIWDKGVWQNGVWEKGEWHNGTWHDGTWNDGLWLTGIWNGGTWKNGRWVNGKWRDGNWLSGKWQQGAWSRGFINGQASPTPPKN